MTHIAHADKTARQTALKSSLQGFAVANSDPLAVLAHARRAVPDATDDEILDALDAVADDLEAEAEATRAEISRRASA